MHPHELPFPHVTRVQAVGVVTVYYPAPNDATISVKTVNGDFFFKPSDLPASDSMHILSTRVEVRRVPVVEAVTTGEYEDDYSAMVLSDDGTLTLTWIGYKDEEDQVFVRHRSGNSWGEIAPVPGASGDLQGLAAAYDGDGALHLVWSKRSDTNGIKEVAVVRDNQYVHTRKGEGERMEFEFREQSLDPGNHYYYVRVEQEDGNVAWASPIWVTKR